MLQPVKIPQNVYVEDRIIGPITLKQLIICGIGAGIGYALYSVASKAGAVSIPMTVALWSPAGVAAAFAFVKINDLSLFNIILLMIERANKPNVRTWSGHPGISINIVTRQPQAAAHTDKKLEENVNKLADLTKQMERRERDLSTLAEQDSSQIQTPEVAAEPPGAAVPEAIEALGKDKPIPVKSDRISAQGLDPARSIDGLSENMQSFGHLFKDS